MADTKTIYQRFNKALKDQRRTDFVKDVDTAKRTFKGQIFEVSEETSMKKSGIPPVRVLKGTTNTLRLASIVTANRPELKAIPIGRADGATATLVGRAYKNVWEQNVGNKVNFKNVLTCIKEGIAHFNVTHEKYGMAGDVRIYLKKLGSKKVIYDPDTPEDCLEDWGHRFVFQEITPQEAKDLYGLKEDDLYYANAPDIDDNESAGDHDSEPGGRYDDDTGMKRKQETKRNVFDIEYWEKRKQRVKLLYDREQRTSFPRTDQTAKDNQTIIEQVYNTGIEDYEGRFMPVDVISHDLYFQHVVGKKIVDEMVNPEGKDNLNLPIDPVITIENIPIGELYPRGNMYFAHWPLKEISKRRGQSIAVVSFTMGSPVIAKKGTVDVKTWQQNISKPREILEYDSDDPSEKPSTLYQQIPDLSRVFELEARAEADLNDVFNLTPVLKGEAETGRMSGRLAAMLKEFGMEGNSYLITELEAAYRKLGVCIISIAMREWPPHYWDKLIEEEDKDEQGQLLPEFQMALQKLKGKDISIVDLDIGIRSGSSLPTNRMARLDMAMELGQKPIHPDAVYDAEAILTYIDDPQAAQVLKRKGKLRQAEQMMQGMGQELEQKTDQLKTLLDELEKAKEDNDKMKIQHVEDMGKMKWRYETTIEKMNLKLQAQKAQAQAQRQKASGNQNK